MQPDTAAVRYRLPAEWEAQSATLLAWPFAGGDWSQRLAAIQDEYLGLIEAILEWQAVLLLVQPGSREAAERLGQRSGLSLIEAAYNDTWCRDYGPITLLHRNGRLAVDFLFNGWGGKYDARLDNRVNATLARQPSFLGFNWRSSPLELEGGAIESDGQGRLLINWHCLQTRHPGLARAEIERQLRAELAVEEVIGIDFEPMAGDDTDGHIDTLVRFVDADTLAYQRQADVEREARLRSQVEALRTRTGSAYRLIALPAPADTDPNLPANYVNFLFVNGACLVPAYNSSADAEAEAILAEAMPDRHVRRLPASALITQFGGIHCATMHIPAASS